MLNATVRTESWNPTIRKVTSYESILDDTTESWNPTIRKLTSYETIFDDTKSFAEEVADALCTRAGNIGNSHPSVTIGKQKRLIDDLVSIAEAVRTVSKDFKCESRMEPDICVDLTKPVESKENHFEGHNSLEPDMTPRKNPIRPYKTILKKPKEEIRQSPVPVENNSTVTDASDVFTSDFLTLDASCSMMPGTSRGPVCTQSCLPLDINGEDDFTKPVYSEIRTTKRSRKRYQYEPLNAEQISRKRRKPIKILSKKKREAFRSFILSKFRNKPKSADRPVWRNRIGSLMSRNSLKTARKRLQSAFSSSIKTAEGTFNRIKENVRTKIGKQNIEVDTEADTKVEVQQV